MSSDEDNAKNSTVVTQASNLDRIASSRPGLPRYGRLSVSGDLNFNIPTQRGDREHVEEHHGKESWRMRILEFLHRKSIQIALMALLSLDVILLFVELFLIATFPACDVIKQNCASCCEYSSAEHDAGRLLSGGGEEEICESGLEPDFDTGGCDPGKWSVVHTVETVLFSLTVVILSIFFIELNIQVAALGPRVFFRQLFYALDYFIVTLSLVLELSLHSISEDSLATFLGLLIFARVWRFVRIGHGIIEVTSELIHAKHEEIYDYIELLEEVAKENRLVLPRRPSVVTRNLSSHEEATMKT